MELSVRDNLLSFFADDGVFTNIILHNKSWRLSGVFIAEHCAKARPDAG